MEKKNIAFLLGLLFVFTACNNQMPFDINDSPPKLTVNTLMDGNKTENLIFLSLTGRDRTTLVTDAVISVYINNQLKEQITEFDKEKEGFISKSKFDPGDKVRIEVNTIDGKYHAWAEEMVPKPVERIRIDTMSYTGNYDFLRIETTFTDDPDEKNYYRLAFFRRDTIYGTSWLTNNDTIVIIESARYLITHEDIVLNEGRTPINDDNALVGGIENSQAIFDDSRLNGEYTMAVSCYLSYYLSAWNIREERVCRSIEFSLRSITESQYYYLKALNLYHSSSYDEYLSQPISFPSNVHGGAGMVGFETGGNQFFHLPDYISSDYNSPGIYW